MATFLIAWKVVQEKAKLDLSNTENLESKSLRLSSRPDQKLYFGFFSRCVMSTMVYEFGYEGLKVVITATEITRDDGSVYVKLSVMVVEGSLDINAIWWSNPETESDFEGLKGKDNSLNMNGEGSLLDGEEVLWDGYHKVGSPGTDKDVLEADGAVHEIFLPDGITLEDMAILGLRATSVGEDGEGSVKLVAAGVGELIEEDPVVDDDNFEEWGEGGQDGLPAISHITLYFQIDADKDSKIEGWFTVKFDYHDDAHFDGINLSQDLDDDIGAFLDFLIAEGTISDEDVLVGVGIKGGPDEFWYNYFDGNDHPGPDDPPDGIDFPIQNRDVDVSYVWQPIDYDGVVDGVWMIDA